MTDNQLFTLTHENKLSIVITRNNCLARLHVIYLLEIKFAIDIIINVVNTNKTIFLGDKFKKLHNSFQVQKRNIVWLTMVSMVLHLQHEILISSTMIVTLTVYIML